MLYAINKSPLTTNSLQSALLVAAPGDPLLLYEDGVYAALVGTQCAAAVTAALTTHAVYALDVDLQARGLTSVLAGVQVIDYDGFVKLVEEHDLVPWL